MYDLISKMPFNRAMNIIVIIFGCLVAPYWYLFSFFPKLIEGMDIFRLILTCGAISLPLFLTNYTIHYLSNWRSYRKYKEIDRNLQLMIFPSICLCVVFYMPLVRHFFDNKSKPIEDIIGFQVAAIGALIALYVIEKCKRKIKFFRIRRNRERAKELQAEN